MKTFHIIPNAHLDPVWLWDEREGLNQSIRTFRSVLDLMDEFPFLTFMRGESVLYRHLEENDPETFSRVLARIREGRWEVVGGTEVQPDTNLPGTETLLRQYSMGLEWFRMHLGVRPRVAWAADSFGHAAGLPEVLLAAGMESFAFTRPFPAILPTPMPAFWWRAPSGRRILCYRPEVGWYGTRCDQVPPRLDDTLADAAKRDLDNVPVFIGVGDHGGGPSRKQIRQVLAWSEAHPEVRVVWSGLQRFFDALRAEASAKGGDAFFPEIGDELGFTLRGCYTSNARIKFAFRRAEAELAAAERITSLVTHHLSPDTRNSTLDTRHPKLETRHWRPRGRLARTALQRLPRHPAGFVHRTRLLGATAVAGRRPPRRKPRHAPRAERARAAGRHLRSATRRRLPGATAVHPLQPAPA